MGKDNNPRRVADNEATWISKTEKENRENSKE